MSALDPTHATRQARYRERVAQAQAARDATMAAQVADLVLARLIPFLVDRHVTVDGPPVRAVDKSRPSRSRPVDKASRDDSAPSADSGPSRDGARAPAYARGNGAPAPYGGNGAHPSEVREDAAEVLAVMAGRQANAGSVKDALGEGWGLGRIVAALVLLQSQGQVTRTPGDGPVPDRWTPVAAPLEGVTLPPPFRVDAAPEVHVTCQDYQAHGTAHAWDPDLGAFRCPLCQPMGGVRPPPAPPALTAP